jgi:hypothetical protein
MRTARASLIAIVGGILAIFVFAEAWRALQSGVVSVGLGRRRWGFVYTVVRVEEPLAFHAALAFLLLVAIAMLVSSLVLTRKLLLSTEHERKAATQSILADIERNAPSGLRPLWVGLVLAAACFVLYVTAA